MIPGILASSGRYLDLSALSNCALWLDASDASTITHSGGAVSQINDKSGNARHLTQGTGANQPRIDATTQNGLAVLDFDGVNDVLTLGSNGLGRNVAGMTIHLVCRTRTPFSGPNSVPLFELTGGTSVARAFVEVGRTSYKPGTGGRRLDGDSFASIADTDSHPGGFVLYTVVYDYANSDIYFYVNGTQKASSTSYQSSGNTSDTNSTGLALGGNVEQTAFLDGQVGEFAVFHEVQSADTLALVSAYLTRKWGGPEVGLGNITWQTPVDIGTGTSCLDTPSGQVVEYGWRFTSTSGTVNGIAFAEGSCENETGEATSGLDYTNSDSTFQALLNSFEYKWPLTSSPPSAHLRIRLTGLTKGQRYAVQLFAVDKRASLRDRNQRYVDGYGNESASVQMGAEKYVIGEFVASGPTQLIMVRYVGGPSDAAAINLLVLRRFV